MKFTFKLILKNMRKVFKNFLSVLGISNQQISQFLKVILICLLNCLWGDLSSLSAGSQTFSAVRGHHGFLEILQVIMLPAMQ